MLVLFFVVVYLSSAAGNAVVMKKAVVSILVMRTDEFHCSGSIVSKNTVLTTCKCVGHFTRNNRNGYYEYKYYDVKEYVIFTGMDGKRYNIHSAIVSSHCRPSEWSSDVFDSDLGGWKIDGAFDMNFVAKFIKPKKKRTDDYESLYREVQGLACFISVHNGSGLVETAIEIIHDLRPCIDLFCYRAAGNKLKWSCIMSYIKFNRWINACHIMKVFESKWRYDSSPLYCEEAGKFILLGQVVRQIHDVLIWARTDLEPNSVFWEQLISWSGSAAVNLRATVVTLVACSIFNFSNSLSQ